MSPSGFPGYHTPLFWYSPYTINYDKSLADILYPELGGGMSPSGPKKCERSEHFYGKDDRV